MKFPDHAGLYWARKPAETDFTLIVKVEGQAPFLRIAWVFDTFFSEILSATPDQIGCWDFEIEQPYQARQKLTH